MIFMLVIVRIVDIQLCGFGCSLDHGLSGGRGMHPNFVEGGETLPARGVYRQVT